MAEGKPPLCVDCVHSHKFITGYWRHRGARDLRDPVTGICEFVGGEMCDFERTRQPLAERIFTWAPRCGPEGRFFEAKTERSEGKGDRPPAAGTQPTGRSASSEDDRAEARS